MLVCFFTSEVSSTFTTYSSYNPNRLLMDKSVNKRVEEKIEVIGKNNEGKRRVLCLPEELITRGYNKIYIHRERGERELETICERESETICASSG